MLPALRKQISITFSCVRNEFFGIDSLPAMRFLTADTHGVVPYDLKIPGQLLGEVTGSGQDGMMDMTPASDSWVQTEVTRVMNHIRDHEWISEE